jgi:hypothetical protein
MSPSTTTQMKVNGTEKSILTSLCQTLRTFPSRRINGVTSGKSGNGENGGNGGNGFIFAACRVNKFDLDLEKMSHVFSKFKHTQMMYVVIFMLWCCGVVVLTNI